MNDDKLNTTPSFLQTFKSVSAAMFGVQNSGNHERDFTKGKASHFILMGIISTILFILMVWGIVKLVMHFAGV